MKPLTKSLLATALALGLMATQANAGWSLLFKKGYGATNVSSEHLPPDGYNSQWWVHPSGCEYSRAGRPGEIVWYVIINSIGRRSCPAMIVQQAYPGFNS
jgi:hypothetical protein